MIRFRQKQYGIADGTKKALKFIQKNPSAVSIPLSATSLGVIVNNSRIAAKDRKQNMAYRDAQLTAMNNLTGRLDRVAGSVDNATGSLNKVNTTLTKNNQSLATFKPAKTIVVNTGGNEDKSNGGIFSRFRKMIFKK